MSAATHTPRPTVTAICKALHAAVAELELTGLPRVMFAGPFLAGAVVALNHEGDFTAADDLRALRQRLSVNGYREITELLSRAGAMS